MHCMKRLTTAFEQAGVPVSFQPTATFFLEFVGLADLEPALKTAAEFAKIQTLKVSVTGPGRLVYSALLPLISELFGSSVAVLDETELAVEAVNRCIRAKHGLHRIQPKDYFADPKPDVLRLTSDPLTYPFILVDIRLNSRYIRVV